MKDFRLLLFIVLMLFWIVLTSTFNVLSLGVGVIICGGVTLFSINMREDSSIKGSQLLKYSIVFVDFLFAFLIEVVKANIDVAKIVLAKNLDIQPQFIQLDVSLKQKRHVVLLANAITLTPGTLSVDVVDNHFVIHALTDQAAQAMLDPNNVLILKIMKLEELT